MGLADLAKTSVQLSSGNHIPLIGYGAGTAWYNKEGNEANELNKELIESIKSALKVGYRHLDAAEIYGTEREVGVAIKESDVPRSELFVTTKVFPNLKDPAKALQDSLARLQLDYVDLYLIHAPFFSTESHGIEIPKAWAALEGLHEKGLTKSIGVSNFRIQDLELLLKDSKVAPSVNQIEFHPYLQSPELLSFCQQKNIRIEAYGPLTPIIRKAGGPIDTLAEEIGKKHGRTPGQVLLRWAIQKGAVAVTTSSKPERQEEQLLVLEFELTEEEVKQIDEVGKKVHFRKFWAAKFEE